jgi:poly-gamma-glutamate capsule biosynthesis protein CapA/YwtB (metallophosphatase superfamily)
MDVPHEGRPVMVFLGGDVMTGRGLDQVLPHPGDPQLWERDVPDARAYVALAERVNGPIPRPVDFSWPWGDALEVLDEFAPDVRLVNLETAVTRSDDVAHGKYVHYRMAPQNVGCLSMAGPIVCALANNHVLDFGPQGLEDTLATLEAAGIPAVGAGRTAAEARRPVAVPVGGRGRVIVFAFGASSSGIPRHWAARNDRPGVALLPDLTRRTADDVVALMQRAKRPGDVVVASVHWGSNWGYAMPDDHIGFAHRLIDGGVDIVHGHSSHHPRPIEVYRGKLILYGCGDLIDDYEGIGGYDKYRDDLRLLYFASVHPDTGDLLQLRMVPMQARRMRLHRADDGDVAYLRDVVNRACDGFGSHVHVTPDRRLTLRVG